MTHGRCTRPVDQQQAEAGRLGDGRLDRCGRRQHRQPRQRKPTATYPSSAKPLPRVCPRRALTFHQSHAPLNPSTYGKGPPELPLRPIRELNFGFADAENYRRRENRDLFNQIFFRTENLDKLCDRSTFFLLGEKGTGKAAYAVYFANTSYNDHIALHKYIRETDYNKFISMKTGNNLGLSDYAAIWKVIIELLLAEHIISGNKETNILNRFHKMRALKKTVDEYYSNAFSPEIVQALQFVEKSRSAAALTVKHAQAEGENEHIQQSNESRFQTNLSIIQRSFEQALASAKLNYNYLMFIDGIDIRPNSIAYAGYLECIRGLANAIWSLNNDFFPAIRDSKGRLRVILLVRPDIFNSLGLQNRNTKLMDNSILLDWRTTYTNYRNSPLFEVSDRILRVQQEENLQPGEAWDQYFPFDANTVYTSQSHPSSFIEFLRYSFHRPRDIITMLSLMKEVHLRRRDEVVFYREDFMSPEFRNAYSSYLLGEVRDQLVFYYTDDDFEVFLKFFEFLLGKAKFDYEEYMDAFAGFASHQDRTHGTRPVFAGSADEFLQFLYELNVICYKEETDDEVFIRWCFRERNPTNISPKVKTGVVYEIHYGLLNALNTGKPLRSRRRPRGTKATARTEAEPRARQRVGAVSERAEVVYVRIDRGVVVLRLERSRRRVRAPAAVLGGPGRRLLKKGRLADVICVEEGSGSVSVSEVRIAESVWSATSGCWK
jgi:hypothetical protein